MAACGKRRSRADFAGVGRQSELASGRPREPRECKCRAAPAFACSFACRWQPSRRASKRANERTSEGERARGNVRVVGRRELFVGERLLAGVESALCLALGSRAQIGQQCCERVREKAPWLAKLKLGLRRQRSSRELANCSSTWLAWRQRQLLVLILNLAEQASQVRACFACARCLSSLRWLQLATVKPGSANEPCRLDQRQTAARRLDSQADRQKSERALVSLGA